MVALAGCMIGVIYLLMPDWREQHLGVQPQCMTRACEALRYFAYEPLVAPPKPTLQAGDWPVILTESISKPPCTVFSVGVADQPEFDNKWAERGCAVKSFDPTISSCKCHKNVDLHITGLSGPDDSIERVVYHNHYPPATGRFVTLEEARQEAGYPTGPIQAFKPDCEGCEISVLHDVATRTPEQIKDIEQLLFELHMSMEFAMRTDKRVQQLVEIYEFLQKEGFVLFHRHLNHGWSDTRTIYPALAHAGFYLDSCCLELGFARIPPTVPKIVPAQRTIYATMVTGRDESRLALASLSIESFFRQTYSNRHLIIINDGDQPVLRFLMAALGRIAPAFELRDRCEDAEVLITRHGTHELRTFPCVEKVFAERHNQVVRITEVAVDPEKYTAMHGERPFLGALRNLALAEIPNDEVFVQWDDDDWHEPDYIAQQYRALEASGADCVLLSRQLMYVFRYDSAYFKEDSKEGIFGTIMGIKTNTLAYPNLKRSEDKYFLDQFRKVHVWDNDAMIYVRMVHMSNTWPASHFKTMFAKTRPQGSQDVLSRVVPKYEPFVRNQHPWPWPLLLTPTMRNVIVFFLVATSAVLGYQLIRGFSARRGGLSGASNWHRTK